MPGSGLKKSCKFPNPASSHVNVSADEKISRIQIFNMEGKMVDAVMIDKPETSIDINHLEKGLHLLRVEVNSGFITKRIQVIR